MATYSLVQPSLRRVWQVRSGSDVQAVLRLPTFRSGGRAEAGGRGLRIEKHGQIRAEFAVRDEATGEEVARLRRDGRRSLFEFDGEVAEWKRLGRKEGFGVITPDGETLLRAKVRSGFLRSSGEVEVSDRIAEADRLVAVVLACYLLIRKNEEQSAAAVASTSATAA